MFSHTFIFEIVQRLDSGQDIKEAVRKCEREEEIGKEYIDYSINRGALNSYIQLLNEFR